MSDSNTVYVFFDSISDAGIAKVTAIHYQPEKLSTAQKSKGVATSIEVAPSLKPGFKAELYVNTVDESTFYSTSINEQFFMPYSEYMSLLPLSTVVALKNNRETDPIVDSFLDILESSRDDSASKGVNPVIPRMVEYYNHFVASGYMTQENVDEIIIQ